MSHEILLRQLKLGSEDKAFVVVGVIRTEGPTAIKTGNKALILADGSIEGWVGGHCTEEEIVKNALSSLREGASKMLNLSTCQGGRMDVYLEPYLPRRKLVIFGRVPIVEALARIGKLLNFNVSVVDKLASKEKYPEADRIFTSLDELTTTLGKESLDQTYVVVATMGERDQEYVQKISELGVQYVGVVAGKKRASELISYLRGNNIAEERLAKIKAPAGIYIRAVTSEEIALSVMSEIVEIARMKSGDPREYKLDKFEASGQSKASEKIYVDPVCGMTVDASSEYFSNIDGTLVYFCCEGCKESFESRPQDYPLQKN